jgi:uncharacterized protein HemX
MPDTEAPNWILGVLIGAITALAGVVTYLFKVYRAALRESRHDAKAMEKERGEWTKERESWAREREKIQEAADLELEKAKREHAEQYERRFAAMLERYEGVARADRESFSLREAQLRKDTGDMFERIATEAADSNKSMVTLLQKMSDRFLGGPTRRR